MDKQAFLKSLEDNFKPIREEYVQQISKVHMTTLPGWDEHGNYTDRPTPGWRTAVLWWDGRPRLTMQKKFPITTELVRHGPNHRATAFLNLEPRSQTDLHRHPSDWGDRWVAHLPLFIPVGDVGFQVEDRIHRWEEGRLFVFESSRWHQGFNRTDHPRVMLALGFDDSWSEAVAPYTEIRER